MDAAFRLNVRDATVLVANINQQWAEFVVESLSDGELGAVFWKNRIDARTSAGGSLARYLCFAWRELADLRTFPDSPVAIERLENSFVTVVAFAAASGLGKTVIETEPIPAYLRRAEEYIAAHLRGSCSLADISREARVSASTLGRAFQKRHGMGAMAFMKERRLDAARNSLLNARCNGGTVSEIATIYGFFHLSQFAQDYRKAFGELPSATLRNQ
jgi:AraC-like DNA-binding protein